MKIIPIIYTKIVLEVQRFNPEPQWHLIILWRVGTIWGTDKIMHYAQEVYFIAYEIM